MSSQKPLLFFAKTSRKMRLELLEKCIDRLHSMEIDRPMAELFLQVLEDEILLVLQKIKKQGKSKEMSLSGISEKDRLAKLQAKQTRAKPAVKARKLRFYKSEVLKLKEDGMSWREIAKYLAINHKFKVNYSTIAKEAKKWHLDQKN